MKNKKIRMEAYKDLDTGYPVDDILKKMRQQKEQEELEKQEKIRFIEKREKYAKFVKEMHWPTISKTKQKEMEGLKSSVDFKRQLNRSTHSQMIDKRITTNRSEKRMLRK